MRTTYVCICLLALLAIVSCKKEEPTPTACMSGPETVYRYTAAEYTWCGTDVEDIEWSTSYGETGRGGTFRPTFPSVGKFTITVTGKRKGKSASEVKEVDYGSYNKVRCKIVNDCYTGNQNIQNPVGYKAYLYSSFTDWSDDVKKASHQKALDSTECKYSSEYATIYAEFTSTVAAGVELYFSVENQNESNFRNLKSSSVSAIEVGTAHVDGYSKSLLQRKWKLSYNELNGISVAINACNQDDNLVFFPDGTWNYEIGADNCNGSSGPSNGTYTMPTALCGSVSYLSLTTASGPFTGMTSTEFTPGEIKVSYKAGTNTGFFRFTPRN